MTLQAAIIDFNDEDKDHFVVIKSPCPVHGEGCKPGEDMVTLSREQVAKIASHYMIVTAKEDDEEFKAFIAEAELELLMTNSDRILLTKTDDAGTADASIPQP